MTKATALVIARTTHAADTERTTRMNDQDNITTAEMKPALEVKFFPYQKGRCSGNLVWAERDGGSPYYRVSKYAMKGGVFPPNHPVGGTKSASDPSQMGSGDKIEAFRARGYWASCFPEGDGITFQHEDERSDETVINDVRECFGWLVVDGRT